MIAFVDLSTMLQAVFKNTMLKPRISLGGDKIIGVVSQSFLGSHFVSLIRSIAHHQVKKWALISNHLVM